MFILLVAATAVQAFSEGGHHRGDQGEEEADARRAYAMALRRDPNATLDDLREAVATLEDTARVARRVLGGTHPLVVLIEGELHDARATFGGAHPTAKNILLALGEARATLRARETPSART